MIDLQRERIVFADGKSPNAFQPSLSFLQDGRGLLTMQPIYGGDYYGDVEYSLSEGAFSGKAQWECPQGIPAFIARPSVVDGVREVVVDVRTLALPDGRILAVGGNSFYTERGCAFWDTAIERRCLPRQRAIYSFFTPGEGWSERQSIGAEAIGEDGDLRIACSQMAVTPRGEVVLPCYYGTAEMIDCAGFPWPRQAVKTALARIQGDTLHIIRYGNSLHLPVERGFVEPSVAECQGTWYMTLRAEDGCAYVTTSSDALHWEKPQPWRWWEDGKNMETDSTQQHFFSLNGELYLAYTRKAEDNGDVTRWRAPLFAAQIDRKTLCLKKSSECIVFPLARKAGVPNLQGNFHCVNWRKNRAIVIDGALYVFPAKEGALEQYESELQLAEVILN